MTYDNQGIVTGGPLAQPFAVPTAGQPIFTKFPDPAKDLRRLVGLLNETEVGLLLGVTIQTLATWRAAGYGPRYAKLGKTVFYLPGELNKWALSQSVTPVPPAKGRIEDANQTEMPLPEAVA